MTQEQTQEFVKGCIRGEPPPCASACPFRLDVKDFLAKCARGKWTSAYKTYRNAVVFPVVVAELCGAPCRGVCKLTEQPIELSAVERTMLSNVKKRGADFYAIPPKPQRILIIGAGLRGLACALGLAQKQYQVTVTDPQDGWGGAIRSHPKFDVFDADFRDQFSAVKVEFRYGEMNPETSGYDAVLTAVDRDDPIASIVDGAADALRLETYVQTGVMPEAQPSAYRCTESPPPRELSEPEARAESARCEQCDCSACLDACPMLKSYRKDPKRLALEFFTDAFVNPPLSTHSMTREAYSCMDCGACKAACPQSIDLGRLFHAYRRMRFENGTTPAAFHDIFLRRMERFNESGRVLAPLDGSRYVYFPGCAVATELPDTSARAFDFLRERYGAGLLERCCGSPLIWAGVDSEPPKLDLNATYIYACPSCAESLRAQLPNIATLSVYDLLSGTGIADAPTFTLFHACAARDNHALQGAVERLASGASLTVNRSTLNCCGYGGQTQLANPRQYRETVESNVRSDSNPYLVYCANCRETFKRQGKECYHILELLFPAANVNDALPLTIPDDVRDYMAANLILERDVLDVIRYAESSGEKFTTADGSLIASLVRGALTYWVEYRPIGDSFEVSSAYYHRMKFRQGGAR
ncbi:MAG: 4Fe-4S dicluster domain-containing protein [Oscillospiraceae bacterium]|jgi:Fe-S oxidoreductase|nr:4Fe-4S dicluster domain-containing protein [Oscillospiraceae bacterium]